MELNGSQIEMQNFILTLKSSIEPDVLYKGALIHTILKWSDSAITLTNSQHDLEIQKLKEEIKKLKGENKNV